MAGVLQKPDALSLSGNLKPFVLSSAGKIVFNLLMGDDEEILFINNYDPGPDNLVRIDLREEMQALLSFNLDSSKNNWAQTTLVETFKAVIDGQAYAFRVVGGGVADLADTPTNWLSQHFLTWQPRHKRVTYYSPEWLTFYATEDRTLKLKATYSDGSTKQLSLPTATAGKAYTQNLQYAYVAGLLGNTYPTYYEVWTEGSGGNRSESQFYLYEEAKSADEQWFLFANSLGGIDTIRAYGVNKLAAEHTHNLDEQEEELEEYDVETQRLYVKNTGYLDDYERHWLLDFFPSRQKYIYEAGALRRIVVTDSDATYTSSDLPSSYTFTYRRAEKAALMNLVKNAAELPDSITIPDQTSPNFIIPPRLAELPRTTLSEGVLLPAIDPSDNTPTVTSFGELHNVIYGNIVGYLEDELAKIGMGGGSGGGTTDIEIIKTTDSTLPTDYNVFSALRTLNEINVFKVELKDMFLRKDIDDTAHGNITFCQSIHSEDYIEGFDTGSGWMITKDGDADLNSADIRYNLIVGNRSGSPVFISGFPNGIGWDLSPYERINAADVAEKKWRLEIDDINVRGKMRVYEFVISQLRGENDNVIFAGMMRVDHADSENNIIYLDTEKGVLYNPFRSGDILMVQRFGGMPSAENQYNVIKQYELRVKEAYVGNLSDGEERVDWIEVEKFVGDWNDVAERDVLTRVDSITDSTRKGIVKVTTIDEIGAPYIDVVYGMKTNPDTATKVRMGNLSGVRTRNNRDLTGVWGLYAEGAVLENSTYYMQDGNTIEQNFTILNGKLESEISTVKSDMSLEAGNILRNSSFGSNMNYWSSEDEVHFIWTSDGYIFASDAFYVEKNKVADIVADNGRYVLRLRNNSIKQLNSLMSLDGVDFGSEEDEQKPNFSFAFYYKPLTAGTLSVGFPGHELYAEESLQPAKSYAQYSKYATWNGEGDFSISYTGEILIYAVSLFNDKLADAKIYLEGKITQTAEALTSDYKKLIVDSEGRINQSMESQFKQTAEQISLMVRQDTYDADMGKLTESIDSRFTVQAGNISAVSTRVDNINNTISTSGWINSDQGNKLWASKTLEDGKVIASYINQDANTIKIKAEKLELTGKVTFSMLDADAQAKTTAQPDLSGYVKTATIIEGDKIKTGLINTDELYATHLAATYGTIGGFSITSSSLHGMDLYGNTLMTLNPSGGVYFRNANDTKYAGYGIQGISAEVGLNVLAALWQKSTDVDSQAGMFIRCDSSYETKNLILSYSTEGSYRECAIGFRNYAGDDSWFKRLCMRVTSMPFQNQLKNTSSIGAPTGHAVYWDENSGLIYCVP